MAYKDEILEKIETYKKLIHTQDLVDAAGLWAEEHTCVLISCGKIFTGVDEIQEGFLGIIRNAYSAIDLFSESTDIRLLDDDSAVAVFAYRTECTRRETGEPYGIQGLETQVYVREHDDWRLVHVHYSGEPTEEQDQ